MDPTRITDDLDKLIELLPKTVQSELDKSNTREDLLEVILDLGRLPEARYTNRVNTLGEKYLSRSDLLETVERFGKFGSDNRAGIERTLHRISAIRNRQNDVIGLTCRVGRAVYGTVEIVRDLIETQKSLLLMGRPGVGKTTALREIARVMADDLQRRVVIIDTSNEIAGDGDIPHPAIGKARRMQVALPEQQHQVMIEAVENHMPEVIVIDEIGTELEALAARTIAERGVQLIATAHGNSVANLIKNPTLCDLIGGIQSVTLGDEEARRRRTQKTVLERASDPTFEIAIEINSRNSWSIHKDVSSAVDALLRGQSIRPQEREINIDGSIKLLDYANSSSHLVRPNNGKKNNNVQRESNSSSNNKNLLINEKNFQSVPEIINSLTIFCFGISTHLVEEVIRRHNWPAKLTTILIEANVVLTIRHGLGQNPKLRREAQSSQIPIHVIKSDTLHQIERSIERLINRHKKSSTLSGNCTIHSKDLEDELSAMEECRLALEKIVVPLGQPVELLPRSERVIKMQTDLIKRYQLQSDVFQFGEQQQLRVYPP